MATSRFSLTLFCPMNSCKRCGRSFSSKEESSSTGAAETSRSLLRRSEGRCSARLSLAADTLWFPRIGDVDAKPGEIFCIASDEDEIVMKSRSRNYSVHNGQCRPLLFGGCCQMSPKFGNRLC